MPQIAICKLPSEFPRDVVELENFIGVCENLAGEGRTSKGLEVASVKLAVLYQDMC